MRQIPQLLADDPFPPSSEALDEPNGLLAVGGGLSAQRLIEAYQRGIFPWFEEPQPVLWWTPDPRSILIPEELHISRSLKKCLRANQFTLSVDQCFERVMRECAQPRDDDAGTWIGASMLAAYCDLHYIGHAHSIEVWASDNQLVGGLYGIALGHAYFGESMFSRRPNASKVAMVGLVDVLKRGDFKIIDCQVQSDHLDSLGACNVDRLDFEQRLAQTVDLPHDPKIWHLPVSCKELL